MLSSAERLASSSRLRGSSSCSVLTTAGPGIPQPKAPSLRPELRAGSVLGSLAAIRSRSAREGEMEQSNIVSTCSHGACTSERRSTLQYALTSGGMGPERVEHAGERDQESTYIAKESVTASRNCGSDAVKGKRTLTGWRRTAPRLCCSESRT